MALKCAAAEAEEQSSASPSSKAWRLVKSWRAPSMPCWKHGASSAAPTQLAKSLPLPNQSHCPRFPNLPREVGVAAARPAGPHGSDDVWGQGLALPIW